MRHARTISKLEYIHYSQFVLFQSTNLACISRKVRMRIFPLVMREVTASSRDRRHRSESTSIHYAEFINLFDLFTHNLRASRIVYIAGLKLSMWMSSLSSYLRHMSGCLNCLRRNHVHPYEIYLSTDPVQPSRLTVCVFRNTMYSFRHTVYMFRHTRCS